MGLEYPIVFSHSELESAQRCPFQHQLSYIERWSKPKAENTAAGKGTLWHSVMQAHFNVIKSHQDLAREQRGSWRAYNVEYAAAEALATVKPILLGIEDLEVRELIAWMYKGYVEFYGCDLDWEILEVEMFGQTSLAPPIANEFEPLVSGVPNSELFVFKYFVDLLVREHGRIWVVDHKTVHNFPKDLDLDLDAQFDRYTWAMRQQGTEVFGQQYNMVRRQRLKGKQDLADRHRRVSTHRSGVELDNIADDMFTSIYGRYKQQAEMTQLKIESPRYTSSRHCSFLCDFTDPCLMGRKGYPTREYLEAQGFRPNTPRHTPTERRNAT